MSRCPRSEVSAEVGSARKTAVRRDRLVSGSAAQFLCSVPIFRKRRDAVRSSCLCQANTRSVAVIRQP